MKGFDSVGQRVLDALVAAPQTPIPDLAAQVGASEDVVRHRIQRMQEQGLLRGFQVQLDPGKLGCPYEVLVTGAPGSATTRDALEGIARHAGVTRVFTLASRNSVAFTLCGGDLDAMQVEAQAMVAEAGLHDPEITVIVDTLHDDRTQGLYRAWKGQ